MAFQDVSRKRARDGILSFVAPCYYHFRLFNAATNRHEFGLFALVVPVRPGVCRVFLNTPIRAPQWISHMFTNRFLDSDLWLHSAEYQLRRGFRNDLYGDPAAPVKTEVQQYIIATSADAAPVFFRKWWATHLSLSRVFGPCTAPPHIPLEQQLDRYANHAKHCSTCQDTLRNAMMIKAWSPVLALTVLAVSSSLPVRLAAVVAFALARNVADRLARGVNGPGRGAKVSATKFAPEP